MSKLRGRFGTPLSRLMQRFSSSIEQDLSMLDEDVDGSIAHATVLEEAGLLETDEARRLRDGLAQVRRELGSGSFKPTEDHEDIHMAVEARLIEIVGETGKKLHTARSRNDQVATDVRLWLKRRLAQIDTALRTLIETLLDRIENDGRTLMPGYTHLQRGQPILLGHHLLAHVWALTRDRRRLSGCLERVDRSPLGACAMAGTSHPIDRARAAELLGFAAVADNAMDAVAAVDHEQEAAACCAIAMGHLSRMAEEIVLWSSSEFGFVRLSEAHATGSSIMPQKRNPDAAELIRGKTALVQGRLMTLLGLSKSLPLAYNRDLQEGRVPLFDAVRTTRDSLLLAAEMWAALEFRHDRFEAELAHDSSLATELADGLVGRGVPFREAHGIVGRLIRWCEDERLPLGSITQEMASRFHPDLARELGKLDPHRAVEAKTSEGGTAWSEVLRQVARLRHELEQAGDR